MVHTAKVLGVQVCSCGFEGVARLRVAARELWCYVRFARCLGPFGRPRGLRPGQVLEVDIWQEFARRCEVAGPQRREIVQPERSPAALVSGVVSEVCTPYEFEVESALVLDVALPSSGLEVGQFIVTEGRLGAYPVLAEKGGQVAGSW